MGAGVVKEATGDKEKCQTHTNTSFSNKAGSSDMSCEMCNVTFSLFKRKKKCLDCGKHHCSDCLTKEKVGSSVRARCQNCKVLSSGNFTRHDLMNIKIKDLQHFLQRQSISTQDCREKDDLVELILAYTNNSIWRQQQEERERHLEELKERKRLAELNSRASLRAGQNVNIPVESSSEEVLPNTSQETNDQSNVRNSTSSDSDSVPDSPQMPEPDTTQSTEHLEVSTIVEDFTPQDPNPSQDVEGGTQDAADTTKHGRASLDTVKEVGDIEELTVRQLKEILACNFVDYKGCCEKWELMERVKRLWQSHLHNTDKDEILDGAAEDDVCKICMDAMIDCVLLECGHMVTCTQCGKRMSECPVCRQYVSRVVHIFKA